MIKQIAIIPFLLGTPTIKNALDIYPSYTKAITSQISRTLSSGNWLRATIYDYGNIGQNNVFGLDLSMRQIEYVETSFNNGTETISVENLYYIEIKTNSLKFNGSAIFNSITNYLPENWKSINLKQATMTYETGYNIYDISTTLYEIDAESNYLEIKSCIEEIDNAIDVSDNSWQIDRTANENSTTAQKNGVFNQMNNILIGGGYYFNYTRQYDEEIAFCMYTTLVAEGQYTNSQEESYININQNAVNTIQWSLTLDQSTPPPTPTPTPGGYEVIDIPGLIFYMLGMPFAWISTAFNLTLFPNTPYSLNIGTLFLGLVGVVLLIFILKKLLK